MTSRLDRLFVLLETGSSPVTRKAAAAQLGEVQKLHPHELHNLLAKVHTYLCSSSWETRIAAGQAVEAIIGHVPQWEPQGTSDSTQLSRPNTSEAGRLKFASFDIKKVLSNGMYLMASEGKEFEVEEEKSCIDSREKLAVQRQLLNKRLGLEIAEQIGIDISDIVTNEDLSLTPLIKNHIDISSKQAVADIIQQETELSSREMNRAKRKARLMAKQKSGENQESLVEPDEPEPKKGKTEATSDDTHLDAAGEVGMADDSSMEWPFENLCEQLAQDLFSPSWEVRHGAGTALREIVRIHGKGAGKSADLLATELELVHQQWLEDMSLRLLCVLALDRFGDFVSDQVVAPVRETCTQALGAVLNLMSPEGVHGVMRVLLQLLDHGEWEARHGGLLGLKYLLAVRKDMTEELLPQVFEPIFAGLGDLVDDVSAVAAAALIPVAPALADTMSDRVDRVVRSLWDVLRELDDLTSSSNSIMSLLAALLAHPATHASVGSQPLSELVPRLWPFLSHASSSVRRSTLQTLLALTDEKHPQSCSQWLPAIAQEALRHIYQRCLLEHIHDILDLVEKVWFNLVTRMPLDALLLAACPLMNAWLFMMMHPSRVPLDSSVLIQAKSALKDKAQDKSPKKNKAAALVASEPRTEQKYYIGGSDTVHDASSMYEKRIMLTRCTAARLLGLMSCYIVKPAPGIDYSDGVESPMHMYVDKVLLPLLGSKSALHRIGTALVISNWAGRGLIQPCPESLRKRLLECLSETLYFDELAVTFTKLQQDAWDFIATLRHYKIPLDEVYQAQRVLSFDQIQKLSGTSTQQLFASPKLKQRIMEGLEERRRGIYSLASEASSEQMSLSVMTQAALAGAVTMLQNFPEKVNPVVRPLMEAIKKQENEQLQSLAARHLAELLELCLDRSPSPNAKIIKNVCNFLCSDPEFTPRIQASDCDGPSSDNGVNDTSDDSHSENASNNFSGILSLTNQLKNAEKAALRRSGSVTSRSKPSAALSNDMQVDEAAAFDDEMQKQNELQRRGATFALTCIAAHFGVALPNKVPDLWQMLVKHVQCGDEKCTNIQSAQDLVFNLQVFEVVVPSLHKDLLCQMEATLSNMCGLLEHPFQAVRHMASRCLGTLSKVQTTSAMCTLTEKVLPLLGATNCDTKRQGAMEALSCVIDQLGLEVVPYIVLLIVPILGCMSDQNAPVRLMATHCFATLIRLMPLEGGVPDPPDLTPDLVEKKARERQFLDQLFNPRQIEGYKLPVPIKAELRSYQQAGVNWLAFLNRYKLHGILCDDMGLGKTLQSICILAGDHYYREQEFKETKSPDSCPLASLVVCPPTLTGHWVYEVEKFVSRENLNLLHYTGPPQERYRLRSKVKHYNLVVASYDIVRNDIDFFSSIRWNYCILDEGHIIKNGKTKSSKAIKQLVANHRLILSGTPIQNNVLELWSLFDFLMPGFLGTEKQFNARYSKPILASREAKSSSKEQEAGALAMESLHRQVLPFLLRRMKEDVLQDLPPKITQDYYCELSPLQEQMYEDFARSKAHRSLTESLASDDSVSIKGNAHVFQALQYLRKVCNHPKLVLVPQHPEYNRITQSLVQQNSNLSDIQHATKLPALKQLLLDCGIGATTNMNQSGGEPVVNQHRALIFCQLKAMLDILENDLFKTHMPTVSYLRLDGSIPAGQRHAVVTRFNYDPSIDILLLTTQVGGLGLNLMGADTVIFVEHDWNPMKDLQAMDRAHRIGQKKVVNVYRLVTRGTLEEKIMGLQKFKLLTANTVISQENSSLESMGTDQLLDLFSVEEGQKGKSAVVAVSSGATSKGKAAAGMSMHSVLEMLPELWDDKQYEEEYDLNVYMESLKK